MADDVRALSAELARDPTSLVFLELGEKLRRRGQYYAAVKVILGGLQRHPDLVEGHDLYARVLVDMGEDEWAGEVWQGVLERDARHGGAHKGLGFLAFRRGGLEEALDHLELALAADPTDPSVVQALKTVREAAAQAEAAPEPVSEDELEAGDRSLFAGLEGGEFGTLLVDEHGRVLGGGVRSGSGGDEAERVAAYLAGAAEEAHRCTRLLELGPWRWIVAECDNGNLYVTEPMERAVLLIVRDRSIPVGRLTMLAERASDVARRWLEAQRL